LPLKPATPQKQRKQALAWFSQTGKQALAWLSRYRQNAQDNAMLQVKVDENSVFQ